MALDKYTGNQIGMTFEHYMVHDSEMYNAHHTHTVTAASTQEFFIQTGAIDVHAKMAVSANGYSAIRLYEGITYTAAPVANSMAVFNMHRDSANSCASVFFYAASWSTNTEVLIDSSIIPGATAKQNLFGGEARQEVEWILEENTKYLVQVENRSGGTISASFNMQFYELDL